MSLSLVVPECARVTSFNGLIKVNSIAAVFIDEIT